jgi:hypothetical protein
MHRIPLSYAMCPLTKPVIVASDHSLCMLALTASALTLCTGRAPLGSVGAAQPHTPSSPQPPITHPAHHSQGHSSQLGMQRDEQAEGYTGHLLTEKSGRDGGPREKAKHHALHLAGC